MGGALNGSVILRGVKIDLDTDIGNGFVIDCCRHIEDPTMITAEQLKAKYQLSEEAWRQLADNEPLQQAVARTKERRIRSGECAAERAQFLFLSAPSVLSTILHDSAASPRHRIEAARELRQTAAIGSEDATPAAERFSIRIDLTAASGNKNDVIVIDAPTKKVGPDVELEPDNNADTPLLAAIAATKRTESSGGGEPI
jgi:archaeosine-15-forming tRNA-guanine transglycosylase